MNDARLKRLRMRSWRRGIKEMDLILGPFADAELTTLDAEALDRYEALLAENDHDLYQWVTARIGVGGDGGGSGSTGPEGYGALLDVIARHAAHRLAG